MSSSRSILFVDLMQNQWQYELKKQYPEIQ